MKIPYKYKKIIPNILTSFRLIIAPIILLFGFLNQIIVVLILTIIGAITDLFDGYLARKWQVVSTKGAKLDAVSDKVFASSLLLALTKRVPILLIVFILEIITGLMNLYYYKNLKKSETLFIGKIKTTILFTLIVISFIYASFNRLEFLTKGLSYTTINLQILVIISYTLNYIDKIKKIKNPPIEELEIHKKLMEDTIEIKNLNDYKNEEF